MYFVQTNKEIHLSFKNSEKYWTQALKNMSKISIFGTKLKRPFFFKF